MSDWPLRPVCPKCDSTRVVLRSEGKRDQNFRAWLQCDMCGMESPKQQSNTAALKYWTPRNKGENS